MPRAMAAFTARLKKKQLTNASIALMKDRAYRTTCHWLFRDRTIGGPFWYSFIFVRT
jgi:hypothetical protein